MNRLGMIVDISHASDKTFHADVLRQRKHQFRLALQLPRPLRKAAQHIRR